MSDWINGRSPKVAAIISTIAALDYSDDDFDDLIEYLAGHCDFNWQHNATESNELGIIISNNPVNPSKSPKMPDCDDLVNELKSIGNMELSIPPVDAYSLIALVQSAIVNLDIPSEVERTGRNFVNGFCDRFREQLPTVVHTVQCGWLIEYQITAKEFEESIRNPEDYIV